MVVIREKPEEVLPTIPVSLVEESLSIVHRQLMSSLEGMKVCSKPFTMITAHGDHHHHVCE